MIDQWVDATNDYVALLLSNRRQKNVTRKPIDQIHHHQLNCTPPTMIVMMMRPLFLSQRLSKLTPSMPPNLVSNSLALFRCIKIQQFCDRKVEEESFIIKTIHVGLDSGFESPRRLYRTAMNPGKSRKQSRKATFISIREEKESLTHRSKDARSFQ